MAEEKLNPANQQARQDLCQRIIQHMDTTGTSHEQIREQLVLNGVSVSWAAILVYNAESEVA